jgi:hypothetical protein
MVKQGQLVVSKADSPKQGERRDPGAPKTQQTEGPGSRSRRRERARPFEHKATRALDRYLRARHGHPLRCASRHRLC